MLLRADFKPLSPFKNFPESYTLFGAICWGIRILFGERTLEDVLEEFKFDPPFLISSPVLRVRETFYFPKPSLPGGYVDVHTYTEYKAIKKVKKARYITQETFKRILDGRITSREELSKELENNKERLYIEQNLPHASINRITWTTTGGELYNEPVYYFGVPFSVFILLRNRDRLNLIESALRWVPLGGNKSTGMGFAEVSISEEEGWLKEYVVSKTKRFISLSPHFYDGSFDLENSYYEPYPFMGSVENFYGRITSSVWKKRVLYIGKGSNISIFDQKDFYGSLKVAYEDKNTGKRIYQYGFAFPLYVREEK